MALIELHTPPDGANNVPASPKDTFLDLRDGTAGHLPDEMERDLPDQDQHVYLATGVDYLKLNIAIPAEQDFDQIDYKTAQALEDRSAFTEKIINELAIDAGTSVVIRTDTDPARYFKAYVRRTGFHNRGNPAFSSSQSTLEFEELVKGRVIWPLLVVLNQGNLEILNRKTELRTLGKHDEELLFTLRPEARMTSLEGPGSVTPAEAFFDLPFPISRVIFEDPARSGERLDLTEEQFKPRWVETVALKANFSKSFTESTYLVKLNDAGRPSPAERSYKFTVFLVDKGISMKIWDPTVVVEPQ